MWCMVVDQQWRENDRTAKIEGYTAVSNQQAHQWHQNVGYQSGWVSAWFSFCMGFSVQCPHRQFILDPTIHPCAIASAQR